MEQSITQDIPRKIKQGDRLVMACIGDNNTCQKAARANKLCAGCTTGFNRHALIGHEVGKTFEANGFRYKQGNGQIRKLCIGKNNKCHKARHGGEYGLLCIGCANNSGKESNKDRIKGDVVDHNGKLRVYNGVQLIIPCKFPNCNQASVYDGECKSHSEHWRCKYSGYSCNHIRDATGYCVRHFNNKINKKSISRGELAIIEWFERENIDFEYNPTVNFEGKNMRPDFIFTYYRLVIEFDGEQHFKPTTNWGGDDEYLQRIEADLRKDRWAAANGYHILRVAFHNMADVINIIVRCVLLIESLDERSPPCAFSSDYIGYADRDYITIEAKYTKELIPTEPATQSTQSCEVADADIIINSTIIDQPEDNIVIKTKKSPLSPKPARVPKPKVAKIIPPKPIQGDTRTDLKLGRQIYIDNKWKKLCKINNCKNFPLVRIGVCAKHSESFRCRFEILDIPDVTNVHNVHKCTNTRAIGNDECAFHKGGKILERQEGKQKIIEYLCEREISYDYNNCYSDIIYPDFGLIEPKLIIEFDDIEHFTPDNPNRVNSDLNKDQLALSKDYHVLRIAYVDIDNIYEIIDQCLIIINDLGSDAPKSVFAHNFEGYAGRRYINIPIGATNI